MLTTSEVIEGFVPGGGLAAGLIVGAPLVLLRKPIFNAIQNFSSVLMPEAFTAAEKSYIEAYEIAMEDRIITAEERKFLNLQAKTLGLNESQVEDLESWYDQQISDQNRRRQKARKASRRLLVLSCPHRPCPTRSRQRGLQRP